MPNQAGRRREVKCEVQEEVPSRASFITCVSIRVDLTECIKDLYCDMA